MHKEVKSLNFAMLQEMKNFMSLAHLQQHSTAQCPLSMFDDQITIIINASSFFSFFQLFKKIRVRYIFFNSPEGYKKLLIHVWTGKNSYNFPIRSKLFRNPIN